jgi:molybdate transport system substrate-binding protein
MNRSLLLFAGSAVVLVGLLFLLVGDSAGRTASQGDTREPIVLFCAASNRAVMEAVRADYERECGRKVQIQYGASQSLLSSLEVSGAGDLFLPADDSYIAMAKEKSLVAEVLSIAKMNAVLTVRKGNPKSINTLDDLLRTDVRVVQADPDATAIGKVVRDSLDRQGHWEKIAAATIANRTTVTDVANDVMIGAADAGFVYDAVLYTYPELEAVKFDELSDVSSKVSIAVVASTRQPQAALHFARYVTARDKGLVHYAENGFAVSQGDVWEDTPELTFFAGSMLRPAIDEIITEFEKREGVRVSRVYNGCGILVAQMKAGQHPDAYFACDTEFMNQVPDLFPEPIDVSQNELVILVKKGNPLNIRSLKDLGRDGLRVGVGHEKQCAMGWLTQNTFREGGVQAEVMENVTVQTPSGDMLVNQMQTGSLDAAVAYLSNAAGAGDFLDAIQIQGLQCAIATQPLALALESPRFQTTSRLFDRLCSDRSQATFEAEGFRWQVDARPETSTPAKDLDK